MPSFTTKGLAAVALGAAAAQAQLWDQVIQTNYGPVKGFKYFTNETVLEKFFGTTESNVTAFLGIPFAADTGYQNRWKPPQPREPWNTTLNATSFGPACPSNYETYISEDCLSLNIWTPLSGSDLPVFVYIYGGAMVTGGSSNAQWQGYNFARKDVIYVNFNYRESIYASPNAPELEGQSQNFGIMDVELAVQWVYDNIEGMLSSSIAS